jgi:hypothetical protein
VFPGGCHAPKRRFDLNKDRGAQFALLGLVVLSQLFPAPGISQSAASAEYRSEANALSNLPNFIEWPAETFASAQAPLVVCVYGIFPFGTALSELTRSGTAHGRRVGIRWPRKESELSRCHVLFVSRSERKNYAKIFAVVRGSATLTVGETPGFSESGGIVEFS